MKKVILHVHSDWYSPYAYNEAELFLIWIFFLIYGSSGKRMFWSKNNRRTENEGEEKSLFPFVYAVNIYPKFQAK